MKTSEKMKTQDFKNYLISTYDYILKFDAIKIGCKIFNLNARQARDAYNEIEQYQ